MSFFETLKGLFRSRARNGESDAEASICDATHAISCEEALRRVHEFLDGELGDASQKEVELHFEICVRCYPHLHLERCFREAIRRAAAGEKAPQGLRDRLLDVIEEARSEG